MIDDVLTALGAFAGTFVACMAYLGACRRWPSLHVAALRLTHGKAEALQIAKRDARWLKHLGPRDYRRIQQQAGVKASVVTAIIVAVMAVVVRVAVDALGL